MVGFLRVGHVNTYPHSVSKNDVLLVVTTDVVMNGRSSWWSAPDVLYSWSYWPARLLPHESTLPFSIRNRVWSMPADIWVTL
jgi:hypothetical protein